MKKALLIIVLSLTFIAARTQTLGLIESPNHEDINNLFENKSIIIHFYNDNMAIISGEYKGELTYNVFEKSGFDEGFDYFIHYVDEKQLLELKKSIVPKGELLYSGSTFCIVKVKKEYVKDFEPLNKHSLIYFNKTRASLTKEDFKTAFPTVIYSENINELIDKINQDSIEATIKKLSSYTTRDCYSSGVVSALNWINTKLQSYELTTLTQSLSPYGIPSFNVIAVQQGTESPDEYVIVGGHADSRSSSSSAPGADDNASGVAGVLEIARILSKSTFNRTIIYCAFSGEEYGLYGSTLFAHEYMVNNKNIIGYINLDMIGYKDPDVQLGTSLIYPIEAKPLADYYKEICATYIPDFLVEDGTLIGGDSDHTSFNNKGYQGIFPFENDQHYSPYIHSSLDVLGTSVNCLELAENLTAAALSSVASLASEETSVSINDNLELEKNYFHIFPNPATSILNVRLSNPGTGVLDIYNLLGKLVSSYELSTDMQIDISELKSGTYFVKINSGDRTEIEKLIVYDL